MNPPFIRLEERFKLIFHVIASSFSNVVKGSIEERGG